MAINRKTIDFFNGIRPFRAFDQLATNGRFADQTEKQ